MSKVMRHYTENKLAVFEEWSHMSMGLRYRAGAMGIPFMPSRTMLGSGVGRAPRRELKTMTCPFTGEQLDLLPALNPDVALIHVQRCDAFGNAQLDGLQFMDLDIAMAAKQVIMTTERIVSNEQIRRTPDQHAHPLLHRRGRGRGADRLRAARVLRRLRAVLLPPRRLRARHHQGPDQGRARTISIAISTGPSPGRTI